MPPHSSDHSNLSQSNSDESHEIPTYREPERLKHYLIEENDLGLAVAVAVELDCTLFESGL